MHHGTMSALGLACFYDIGHTDDDDDEEEDEEDEEDENEDMEHDHHTEHHTGIPSDANQFQAIQIGFFVSEAATMGPWWNHLAFTACMIYWYLIFNIFAH